MTTSSLETQLADSALPARAPRSVYIHIPFCSHKCGYCDFASFAGQESRMEEYLRALEAEMSSILPGPVEVETIFVGGGTPTYLPPALLERFLSNVNRWFPVMNKHEAQASSRRDSLNGTPIEFTVESNPNTLDATRVEILAAHGVNRVSFGAQSFQPHLLRNLERDHDPASVGRSIDLVRKRIDNVSLDLIFGIPDQTLTEWKHDLDQTLALSPDHCSAYSLMYEKGTRLWQQRREGAVRPIDEELEASMYEHALDRFAAAGWQQYEISNFCRATGGAGQGGADGRCQHNLTYWRNEPYFGFGVGAAAFVNGNRTLNTRELGAYINRCVEGKPPVTQSETLNPEQHARETAMLRLRLNEGLNRAEFHQRTGFSIDELARPPIKRFLALDLITDDGISIRLTRQGLLVADSVVREFL